MSDWIRFWKDMPTDPRILDAAARLTARLKFSHPNGPQVSKVEEICYARNVITGALVTLWCYAEEHISDDDSLPLSSHALDIIVGLEGFYDLMPRDWIIESDDGTRVVLPGYREKNALITEEKRSVQSKQRMARWRARKKSVVHDDHPVRNVTRNETRNNSVTECVTGAQPTRNACVTPSSLSPSPSLSPPPSLKPSPSPLTLSPSPSPSIHQIHVGCADVLGPVERIFDYWQQSFGRGRCVLDPKRRGKITNAIRGYGEALVMRAIDGYKNSSHHMGDNRNATVYNEISLLLRDAEHIEAGLQHAERGALRPLTAVEETRQHLQKIINGANGHGHTDRSGEAESGGSLGAPAGLFR